MSDVPFISYEDEDVLVVNKPAGWNTHAPSPYAGEGVYEWLRNREPRWANLAILHRLDKETSGLLLFGKTPRANQSLTRQFAERHVRKTYLLVTDRPAPSLPLAVRSRLVRAGERYFSRPPGADATLAETHFPRAWTDRLGTFLEARPLTGRTHQIRVHAADQGFPILGDTLYGGTPAGRLYLHAAELQFRLPSSGEVIALRQPPDFEADPCLALRAAMIDPESTDAYRYVHGAADGHPGWYVDRLGPFLLSQSATGLTDHQEALLTTWLRVPGLSGIYHKRLDPHVRETSPAEASPVHVGGDPAPPEFIVRENGRRFTLSLREGYSVGLFLDQRDNRRRLLTNHVGADFPVWRAKSPSPEVLNVFAYTCGFSVCAALAGARVTSLDLSKKYLEWGRRNLILNGVDPAAHDFIYGDAFDWLGRLGKKNRRFDVILLDPPTFSRSKAGGHFRAESDYAALTRLALPLVRPGGVLFASTNAGRLRPDEFVRLLESTIHTARRSITNSSYAPQPPDFPISRREPAYLKTVWLRLE